MVAADKLMIMAENTKRWRREAKLRTNEARPAVNTLGGEQVEDDTQSTVISKYLIPATMTGASIGSMEEPDSWTIRFYNVSSETKDYQNTMDTWKIFVM